MDAPHQIADLSPAEIWRHGYRSGWDDKTAGLTHLLDDESTEDCDATIIPFAQVERLAREQFAELGHAGAGEIPGHVLVGASGDGGIGVADDFADYFDVDPGLH